MCGLVNFVKFTKSSPNASSIHHPFCLALTEWIHKRDIRNTTEDQPLKNEQRKISCSTSYMQYTRRRVCTLYIQQKTGRTMYNKYSFVSEFFSCCRWKFALSNISLTFSSVISGLSLAEPFGVAFLLFASTDFNFQHTYKRVFSPVLLL